MAERQQLRVAVVSHAAVVAANQEPFVALERAGAEVSILAPKELDTDLRGRLRLERAEALKGRLLGLDVSLGGYKPWLGGQRGIHLIAYRELEQALEEVAADVVFVEEEPYSLAAFQVARWSGRRRPMVVHQNQNLVRELPLPFRWMRRRVLKTAAACTARNPSAEQRLREAGFKGPITQFPHAIDPAAYEGPRRRTGLPSPVVGFVGRLVEEKGILELIESLAPLRRRMPLSLLVVGDGPLRAHAEDAAHRANITHRFLGAIPHEEVPEWYPAMDLVVIPSRPTQTWAEQFGRVVVEAGAAGVAVLASDCGELGATVEATGGGLVYELSDPDGLAKGLERLLVDGRERAGFAEQGRRGVLQHFTHDGVAHSLLATLTGAAEA
ncbi:MAG: glycosyltransferase family 4 protein [Actinomycetota bacterium]